MLGRWLVSWFKPPWTLFALKWRLVWVARTYPRYVRSLWRLRV